MNNRITITDEARRNFILEQYSGILADEVHEVWWRE